MKTKTENKKQVQRIVAGGVLAVGAGMMLYACAYDPSMDETERGSQKEQTNSGRQELRAEIEELPAPNSYQTHLSWATMSNVDSFTIAREDLESGEIVQIMTLPSTNSEFVDRSVKAGHKYRYHLGRHAPGAFAQHDADVVVPLDFVVSGAQVVNHVGPEFNRLWILANSTVLTHGNDLDIEVNKLIAEDNSAIDTAPPEAWAAPSSAGKSGGNLTVRAEFASGRLKILARGQGGGKGPAGAAGGAGDPGPRGSPGTTHRVSSSECDRHCPSHTECNQAPGNGGQGGQGRPGAQGGSGLPGGASAKVFISITQPSDFEVLPFIAPGTGGPGGDGGAGGAGGPGGSPGDCPTFCNPARPGPQGPRGPNGGAGPQGPDGNREPVCLKLGSSMIGECSTFEDMTQ